jgi:hypothetical protein
VIHSVLIGKSEEEDHMKDLCGELCASGRMTFIQILNKQNVKMWTGIIWHQIRSSGRPV